MSRHTAAGDAVQSHAYWSPPFDHETIDAGPVIPNANATDHLEPFGGWQLDHVAITYFEYPKGNRFDWRQRLNAVHMALIPKGPHRGKVLVWGGSCEPIGAPVLVRGTDASGPPLEPGEYHACAPWSIIDPAPSPAGPRFRNFLLPLGRFKAPPAGGSLDRAINLFCAGQAWSPYGDLIVTGGTLYGPPTLLGTKVTFAFNPKGPSRGWPAAPAVPMYAGANGLWEPGPDLADRRFYPTNTLSARLARLAGLEAMLVLGGSVDDASEDAKLNTTWNSYEALVIQAPAALRACGFQIDRIGTVRTWSGPGTPGDPPPVEQDWLEDYPRCHLLSSGRILFSGYAPRWALVDHDGSPGQWLGQANPPFSATNWQEPRHDGSSVLLPIIPGMAVDLVARLGGSDEINYKPTSPHGTTATTEVFVAGSDGGAWVAAADMPNPQPGMLPNGRYLMNVVLLPDASLVLFGGVGRFPEGPNVPINEPLLFRNGEWTILPANRLGSQPSVRDYHSTAVLLPDGRVMLGGGNGRRYDYEFFHPSYLSLPKPDDVRFTPPLPVDAETEASVLGYDALATVACKQLPDGDTIAKVVLIAPGATTHHSDSSQRYVELAITRQVNKHSVEVRAPLHDKLAPRGIYMLFVVTAAGAVADAVWVVLR